MCVCIKHVPYCHQSLTHCYYNIVYSDALAVLYCHAHRILGGCGDYIKVCRDYITDHNYYVTIAYCDVLTATPNMCVYGTAAGGQSQCPYHNVGEQHYHIHYFQSLFMSQNNNFIIYTIVQF